MLNPMLGFFDAKCGSRQIRILVEEFVVDVFFLGDEIYAGTRGLGVEVYLQATVIV